MIEEDKREQLLVTIMAGMGKLLSKRIRTEIFKVELMQPTTTRKTKMMECRVTMRRLDTSKSIL
jgi:hypothetical protein